MRVLKLLITMLFNGCTALADISLPENSLTTIGAGAFSSTALVSFNVPASVTTIGVNPFIRGSLRNITVSPGNQHYEGINGMLIEKEGFQAIQSNKLSMQGCCYSCRSRTCRNNWNTGILLFWPGKYQPSRFIAGY